MSETMKEEPLEPGSTDSCSDDVNEAGSREELLVELARCLKKAREARKLTTEEIALSLKLRSVYIEALESGDWSDMPGEVYALGFLKQYANHLQVDVSDSIEKLKTGHYKLTKPLTFPDPSIAPNKTWVIIAALSFIVLIILFNLFDDSKTTEVPRAQDVEQNIETSMVQPKTVPVTEDATETGISDQTPNPDTKTIEAAQNPSNQTAPPEVTAHRYKLTAVGEDVWLQLTTPVDSSTQQEEEPILIREVLLRAGESTTLVHTSPYLLLTCGNPIALQVEVNGELTIAAGSLGESDKVLHDFRLHPNPS